MIKFKIPFVDLKKANQPYKKRYVSFLKHAIDNSNFIKGKNVDLLEKALVKTFKCKYSLTLNSGTDALIVAIKSLDLKPGDEILTTSNTWISSAYAIEINNCIPKFIDVNKNDFQINPNLIEKKITKKTKAIIVTHLYGMPNDMEHICKIAKKNKLFIIEDIAQSHLAEYKKKIVGNFGDIACMSFYPSKNLGALGDGGAIITNSKKNYLKCKSYANYGAIDFRSPNHKTIGINSRLDEIQAYFLLEKLKKLKKETEKRIQLSKIYNQECNKLNIKYIENNKDSKNVYHLYLVVLKNRSFVKKELLKKNIHTQIHYEIPIHLQTSFNHLKYKKGDLPITEYLSNNILSLPFYPGIEKNKIKYLFKNLKKLIE
jgi:dTDP-4-amino-4,6-dideoxygalactose transaminase